MKVTSAAWQSMSVRQAQANPVKKSGTAQNTDTNIDTNIDIEQELSSNTSDDPTANSVNAFSGQNADTNGPGSFKVSCSMPDDSTGQLASMLARAETKMEVQEVSSKAARALNALKMSAVFAEGSDAKKLAQMIRRMNKLISRIHKKQQQLSKEEALELQRKAAENRKEMQKASEIKEELNGKRTKRRRDENHYAQKELAEDRKAANQEMFENIANIGTSSPSADAAAEIDISSIAAEAVSLDITV